MTQDDGSGLRTLERWLNESAEAAERVLPELLALPAPALSRELRARPELITPGLMQRLLRVAHDALDRLPSRAHELAVVVLRYAPTMVVPPALSPVVRIIRGEAWREYANALREIGRTERALRALTTSRGFFSPIAGSAWFQATVDLVEGPLLHDLGRPADGLRLVRRAAERFALFRDEENFIQARMLEVWMMRAGGDDAGAAALWIATAAAAERHGSTAMAGRFAARMGMLELRHGNAAEALNLLRSAVGLLATAGLRDDEIRARWHYAEAAAACGRITEAVSEYFLVRGELLLRGEWTPAAIASVAVLDLLMLHEPESARLASVAGNFLFEFRDAGLPITALEPFAYLRSRAEHDVLTRFDLDSVRTYFEDLPQRPASRFSPP